jgi:hypothetical protein
MRIRLIEEAINFRGGTINSPQKHKISEIVDGVEVYFLKPGKETVRKNNPNENDMTPLIGKDGIRFTFQDIWEFMIKWAIQDESLLGPIGVLVYRVGYLIDHASGSDGKVRYVPLPAVEKAISDIDSTLKARFPGGLRGFLHFIDLLGWNEDVKYHSSGQRVDFPRYGFRVGRINTALSCLTIPFLTMSFIKDIRSHQDDWSKIKIRTVLDVMQRLSRSRGVCIPTQSELLDWLSPYLVRKT